MNKFRKIKKELKNLKQQKEEAENLVAITKENINQKNLEIAKYYYDFFHNKTKKEFILYDRYPSLEALKIYNNNMSDIFPLYKYGSLNAKELAVIIQNLYQFKRDIDYEILTIGVNELSCEPVYGGKSWSVEPHVYFIIGNDKTLLPFKEYDGKLLNENEVFTSIFLNANGKNLIAIELERGYKFDKFDKMDIECLIGQKEDVPNMINYYDYIHEYYRSYNINSIINIFKSYLRSTVNNCGLYGYKGIKDVLDFKIHISDTFIAKTLISISIYKRNNNLENLTDEDYNHIFDVLFKEKVDIKSQANKNIPKQLIYVPNKTYEN